MKGLITMKSISHYPHSLNTKYYVIFGNPISFVYRRYKCSKASLMDKSHKPLTTHPNAHTEKVCT